MLTAFELPIRERRAIRARVRWLAHTSGRSEVEVLALTLYRVRATNVDKLTPALANHLNALEHLLRAEIDVSSD